jgi:hypothetical protein
MGPSLMSARIQGGRPCSQLRYLPAAEYLDGSAEAFEQGQQRLAQLPVPPLSSTLVSRQSPLNLTFEARMELYYCMKSRLEQLPGIKLSLLYPVHADDELSG